MTKAKAKAEAVTSTARVAVKALRAALKDVSGAVEARNTIPLLANLLLTGTRTALSIEGTDLVIAIARDVAIDGDAPFAVTVSAATLGKVVDKLSQEAEATLSVLAGSLRVEAGRSRFVLPTLPADEFPRIAETEWDAQFEIPALTLGAVLGRTAHAISTDEVRYYLNGVFLHRPEGEALIAATTDGHRLARMAVPSPDGAEAMPDVILPRKAARLLSGLLDRFDGAVEVAVSRTRLRFVVGETVLTTKAIDGQYPDYARIVPTGNEAVLQVGRAALAEAVGRVTTVAVEKVRAVKLALARDLLTLSVSSPEGGTASEEVPCAFSANPIEIGFNARYLLDTLGQLTAETIEARFADAAAPALWRDGPDSPALFVLMPMRV